MSDKRDMHNAEDKTKYHFNNSFLSSPRIYGDVTLHQIGRRYCNVGAVIGEHAHMDYYELTIVTYGRGIITTNGRKCKVEAGDSTFLFHLKAKT